MPSAARTAAHRAPRPLPAFVGEWPAPCTVRRGASTAPDRLPRALRTARGAALVPRLHDGTFPRPTWPTSAVLRGRHPCRVTLPLLAATPPPTSQVSCLAVDAGRASPPLLRVAGGDVPSFLPCPRSLLPVVAAEDCLCHSWHRAWCGGGGTQLCTRGGSRSDGGGGSGRSRTRSYCTRGGSGGRGRGGGGDGTCGHSGNGDGTCGRSGDGDGACGRSGNTDGTCGRSGNGDGTCGRGGNGGAKAIGGRRPTPRARVVTGGGGRRQPATKGGTGATGRRRRLHR